MFDAIVEQRQDCAMPNRPFDETRRRLCQMACATPVLVALGCGSPPHSTAATCSTASIGVGDIASLPIGSARYIESIAVYVCRDSSGVYAIDATCTHIGTDVAFVDQKSGFKCPLHASTFDYNGHVLTGPAMIDLPHYEVCSTSSGIMVIDTAKHVSADTRLLV